MKLNALRTVFGAALVGAVFSAQAVTLSLTGYANGSVGASGSTPSFSTNAGAFTGTLSGAAPFDANPFTTYCVQLTQHFSFGNTPNYSTVAGASYFDSIVSPDLIPGSTIVGRLGKLFTSLSAAGLSAASSTDTSAAIQLAVWESIYEGTGAATLTLTGGLFQATSTAAVVTLANSMLASAAAVTTSLYSISVLENAVQQDFVLLQRVPEPTSLALVGLALAGLASTRRRRA